MRRVMLRLVRSGCVLGFVGALVGAWAAPAWAQVTEQPILHRELKDRLRALGSRKFEAVVEGSVDNLVDVPAGTPRAFHLRDSRGVLLLVRTTNSLPEVNTLLRVKGVAMIDRDPPFLNTPYLFEQVRDVLKQKPTKQVGIVEGQATTSTPPPETPPTVPPVQTPAGPKQPPVTGPGLTDPPPPDGPLAWLWNYVWPLGLGAALLVGAFVFIATRRNVQTTPPPWANPYATPLGPTGADDLLRPPPSPSSPADTPTVQDFKTVKAYKTTKVLPGRLVIVEDGRETDMIHLSDQSGRGEIEIGRDSPDATGGIRIKDDTNTLSRHQAKLSYDSVKREFRLLNLVGDSGNPSVINGRVMHLNEAVVLKDDDVIGMGSVELKFKQR